MRLLIIGDLNGQIGAASRIARSRGAKVAQVTDAQGAYDMLCEGQGADLVMIDVGEDIAELVALLDSARISIPVVACGIEADTQAAVKAIKAGAKEYIPLPPDEELIAAVLEAISEEHDSVIHGSPEMKAVLQMAEQIAASDASVLITGESGTGKEVMARFIHQKSRRDTKPFISLNCAAIPENLLESELFGHEKGAFTGATSRRIGKFEEANQGTILLDEISEMDLHLQAKLLRVLQEREIVRIGSNKPVKVDIRILATSNRDLEAYVKQGNFREDLYFRLNVINIGIPALRERIGDIKPLAEFFIDKYSKANGLPPRHLSADALTKLQQHPWPGNVRELENTLHRSVLLAQGNEITAEAILLQGQQAPKPAAATAAPTPDPDARPAFGPTREVDEEDIIHDRSVDGPNQMVGRSLADVEKELILDTLDHCLGNRTHAANILGISIRTLRNKLKQYNEGGHAA
ncbi:MAG: sigma-54-dependent Fis family transcriptional regulator [Rickettsiales bacterium]|nr:sigma-54-dependent Fis family transcriptional regulator [Rickettsiales bacterium]